MVFGVMMRDIDEDITGVPHPVVVGTAGDLGMIVPPKKKAKNFQKVPLNRHLISGLPVVVFSNNLLKQRTEFRIGNEKTLKLVSVHN